MMAAGGGLVISCPSPLQTGSALQLGFVWHFFLFPPSLCHHLFLSQPARAQVTMWRQRNDGQQIALNPLGLPGVVTSDS